MIILYSFTYNFVPGFFSIRWSIASNRMTRLQYENDISQE